MPATIANQNIKDLYERSIIEKYQNDYEWRRWLLTDRLWLDYFMTRTAIQHHLRNISFNSCLEFGPGSGTFTPLVYRRNPDARLDLIDISEEMKRQFTLEMRSVPNVNYMVGDIMTHEFGPKTYDLFYSVRAVEYVDNQVELFKKVFQLLNPGGHGVVVTKNPFYDRAEHGEGTRWQHRGKLGIDALQHLLSTAGFTNVSLCPVIIRFPLVEKLTLRFTKNYFQRVHRQPLKRKMSRFIESYIITFAK